MTKVPINVGSVSLEQTFLTGPIKNYALILGHDFLVNNNCIHNFASRELSLQKDSKPYVIKCEVKMEDIQANFLKASRDVNQLLSDPQMLRPPIPTIEPTEDIFRVWVKAVEEEYVPTGSQSVFQSDSNTYCVQLEADFDEYSAEKGKNVGIDIANINLIEKEINTEPPAIVDWDEAVEYIKMPKADPKSLLTPSIVKKLRTVFEKEKDILQPPETQPLEGVVKHRIDLKPDARVQFEPARRAGPAEMLELHKQLQYMLSVGYIRPSQSAWGSPITFAPKPGGKLRLCTDFRKLNSQCMEMRGGLPKIADIFDVVGQEQNKVFSVCDLRWGYWNVPMDPESIPYTAMTTPLGSYELLVLQFGLNAAVSSFQNMMQHILRPYLTVFCMVYIDDIIIFSKNEAEHMQHIKLILEAINKARLKINIEKCEFFKTEVKLLGWYIGVDGRRVDPQKTTAVTSWPRPKTAADIAQFLGLCKHIGDVIPRLAHISAPLNEATHGLSIKKKGRQDFVKWNDELENSFQAIKTAMATVPVLQIANITKPYEIECDASDVAIGAVLYQMGDDGKRYPIAYLSKKLSAQERRWPIGEREAFSFVYAFKKWEYLLFGADVKILGDHKPLLALRKNPKPTRKQSTWLEYLESFYYVYEHIKGEDNPAADALSRRPDYIVGNLTFYVMTVLAEEPELYEELRELPQSDMAQPAIFHNFLQEFSINEGAGWATEDAETSPNLPDFTELIKEMQEREDPTAGLEDSQSLDTLPSMRKLESWLSNPSVSYKQDTEASRILDRLLTQMNLMVPLLHTTDDNFAEALRLYYEARSYMGY